jgi:tetratricopeptide (TPR) repeat protein
MTLALSLELVEARTGAAVWQERIQVDYDSLADLEDRVVRRVCRNLALDPTRQEQARMEKDAPTNALAYQHYLCALAQPIGTKEGLRSGLDLLARSLELDASFASAHAAWGYRSYMLASFGYVVGPVRHRMLAEAERALCQSLALNGELLSGLSYLALLYLETGRPEEASKVARRALEINPNSPDARISLGHVYRFAGLFDASELAFERARSHDPYSPRLLASGLTYLYHGKYDEALEVFAREPHSAFSLLCQGMALLASTRVEDARERFEAVLTIRTTSSARLTAEAHVAYLAREVERGLAALQALERMYATAGEGGEALYHYGRLYVVLGNSSSGIALLERAVDHGFFPHPYLLVDPFLDFVRSEPAFQRVLAKAEARHEAFKERQALD